MSSKNLCEENDHSGMIEYIDDSYLNLNDSDERLQETPTISQEPSSPNELTIKTTTESQFCTEQNNEYEQMIQKLEGDVRQHIRIEQQLKLHIESIQEKLEEDEKVIEGFNTEKERYRRERQRMDEMLTIRENQIDSLEKELKQANETLSNTEVK